MTTYNKVIDNLDKLNLVKIRSFLPEYLDSISKNPPVLIDALEKLTTEEIKDVELRVSESLIRTAAFPYRKTLEDFDFSFNDSINKEQLVDLATLRFIENARNILFVGSPGVGKTHLSIALGIKATQHRYSVYFMTCHNLIEKLNKAHKENRLDRQIRHLCQYKLLIIDEIGYLPIDKQGANLFFQLISRRYGNKSTIITTNMAFSNWGDIFNDNTLANAILDRLLHNAYIFKIVGDSYRTKDLFKRSTGNITSTPNS